MKDKELPSSGKTGLIFFLVLGLSFVPVLICCLILLNFDKQETKSRFSTLSEHNVYFQAQNLNEMLHKLRADIRMLVEVAEASPEDRFFFEQLLKNYRSPYADVFGLVALDSQGEIYSSAGQVPSKDILAKSISSMEGLRRQDSFTIVVQGVEDQWKLVLGQKVLSDSDPAVLMGFIPMERLLPVRSLPGTFPARWSALIDAEGKALVQGGSMPLNREVYQEIAEKSIENQRFQHEITPVNDQSLWIFFIPVVEGSLFLGLAFDPRDFIAGGSSLTGIILIMILGCLAVLVPFSYYIAYRIYLYLHQREARLQAMNDQMVEAGKMACIGELASGIAHEINNPLAIMVEEAGWMEDILDEDKEMGDPKNIEEITRSLNQIRNQGRRCKEITHKLLSFARKSDSRTQDLDLNALAEEIAAISEKRALYSGIKFNLELDPALPPIKASATEMQQVFLNFVNNAMDAMENKGGELTISSRKEQGFINFWFRDTGEGIPKANLARIFDPFFTTKPVGKGTGLGLSICYAIIQDLGGSISVESQTGEGTAFHIKLPVSPKRKGIA